MNTLCYTATKIVLLEESYREDQPVIGGNDKKHGSLVLPVFSSKTSILLINAAGVQRLERLGFCPPIPQGPGYWVIKHHFCLLSL